MGNIRILKPRTIRVIPDNNRVVILEEGKTILNVPWMTADLIGKSMQKQARKAEENEKALNIVGDQAFLMRAGIPLGLSNRRDIQKEAVKEALYNKKLRRIMPNKMGNIESKESFGTPSLIQKKPK